MPRFPCYNSALPSRAKPFLEAMEVKEVKLPKPRVSRQGLSLGLIGEGGLWWVYLTQGNTILPWAVTCQMSQSYLTLILVLGLYGHHFTCEY